MILPSPFFCQFSKSFMRPLTSLFSSALLVICASVPLAHAEDAKLVLHRGNSTIVFEPYAPNIIRVTLSLKEDKALAAPGFGFLAKPAPENWAHQQTDAGDEYRSSRISVTVAADRHSAGPPPHLRFHHRQLHWERKMPVILWLLGVPLTVVILLMLLHVL